MSYYNPSRRYLPIGFQRPPSPSPSPSPSRAEQCPITFDEWDAAFEMSAEPEPESEPEPEPAPEPEPEPEVAIPASPITPVHIDTADFAVFAVRPVASFSLSTRTFVFAEDETPTRPHDDLDHHTPDELLSHANKTDVPSSADTSCAVCMGEREITVQFGGCSHAACGPCIEGIWYSRQQHERHVPTWITCHMCRSEVTEVGVLSRAPPTAYFGQEVVHGAEVFTVWGWLGLRRWMAARRESVGFELSRSGSFC
ncbi:hypothetical protein Q9L58_008969 [Maublancomyces gigas]|uniref:RING-type domain-containing protein n=1 Tax=Discina gigas TaxID=1032678 RepID=A0ABR3G884_9PEZI